MQTVIQFEEEQMKLNTQADAIIHFIKEMDIEMLDAFLDDGNTYQNLKKNIFLGKLQDVFKSMQSAGDKKLQAHVGKCIGCNKGYTGFSFVGSRSKNYFDMIVDIRAGRVKDLYQCFSFANADTSIKKKESMEIFPSCDDDAPF